MAKRYTRQAFLDRLWGEIRGGRPLVMTGAGNGIAAKFIERGGVDILGVYNTGYFRMQGYGSLAGMLPILDSNELIYNIGKREVLPQVKEVPVIAGVNGVDPLRDMRLYLEDLKHIGYSGVHNFPTVAWFDGEFRTTLEKTGLGYEHELNMLNTARDLDLLTIGYAFNMEDARRLFAEAAPDIYIFHAGITRGGTTGYAEGRSIEEMAERSQEHYNFARSQKPDVILLAHGAALSGPNEAQYMVTHTDCHGVQLGSAIERMAVEEPLEQRAAMFKQIQFPAGVLRWWQAPAPHITHEVRGPTIMTLRLAFFGNSESVFSSHHFSALLRAPCDLVAVVNVPASRRAGATTNPLPEGMPVFTGVARERGIPVFDPERTDDPAVIEQLRALEPDVFLAAGYALILKPQMIAVPRLLAVNIHASLLPAYRGKHPVFWTLRGGERWAGSTMHVMDPGIDTGDILYQVRVRTRRDDTVASLYERVIERSVTMIEQFVADAERGTLPRRPQLPDRASYFSSTTDEDFRLDWAWSAEKLRRHITMTPGKCWAEFGGQRVYFIDAGKTPLPGAAPPGQILSIGRTRCLLATGDGAIWLSRLRLAGGTQTSMAALCREYGLEPGDSIAESESASVHNPV